MAGRQIGIAYDRYKDDEWRRFFDGDFDNC